VKFDAHNLFSAQSEWWKSFAVRLHANNAAMLRSAAAPNRFDFVGASFGLAVGCVENAAQPTRAESAGHYARRRVCINGCQFVRFSHEC
jgi:hypothetical protein